MGKPSEESTTEDTSTSEESTLKGGMTENKMKLKKKNKDDIEGQLIAGMEKMAGDLELLLSGGDPKQKRFQHLCISKFTAKAYHLNMDFVAKCSKLYIGLQELDLNTGVNRLISCLEHN